MEKGRRMSFEGACFVIRFLLEGIQRTSGLFFLFAVEHFQFSRQSTAVPFCINWTVSLVVGALLRVRDQQVTPSTKIVWACVLSSSGIGFCFLTTSIFWLSVFWGILFGAGFGIFSSSVTSDSNKSKKPSILSSLCSSSPSLACLIYPLLINELLFKYGFNGCVLLIAGILLNGLPIIFISKYNIRFRLSNPKWRLRKRCHTYRISGENTIKETEVSSYKQNDIKEFLNDSFMKNLEPETLQRVNESENKSECIDIFRPIIDARLKISTDCGESFAESLAKETKTDSCALKYPEPVSDRQKYEKCRSIMFEGGFCNQGVILEEPESLEENGDANNENCAGIHKQSEKISEKKNSVAKPVMTKPEGQEKSKTIPPEKIVKHTNNQNLHLEKINTRRTNFPIDIKVQVIECTITTSPEPYIEKAFKRSGYRRHSNSLISGCYDNIDFTKLLQNNKATNLKKHQIKMASRVFLISEEDETVGGVTCPAVENPDIGEFERNSYSKNILQKSEMVFNPAFLTIAFAYITYQLILSVLLTIAADIVSNTIDVDSSPSFVIMAFGIGGIVGQLCFAYWRYKILVDGSNAVAAIMFMLNGLAIAGILWSTDVLWFSGFYATLGFVESGILFSIPNLISDNIEKRNQHLILPSCKCISGVTILFMPFAIGGFKDNFGDYDGLLQVSSCLCVAATILCYFLPKMRLRPQHNYSIT